MKLSTKLGIYALALFSLNILHAKEDEPLEARRSKAESAIQQIKEIKSGIKPENFTGRDMTHLLYEAEMNKELLSEESKTYLSKLDDFTKTYTDYYTTPDKYFRIYYKTSGTDAIPETDDNGNFEPDLVETYGRYLSDAKAKYKEFGLKMPYTTANDSYYAIYISDEACSDGVYGFTRPLSYGLTIGSYVVLRSDYKDFGWGKPTGFADSVAAQITSAHEFQHSVQMSYAYSNMSMFLMEGCAVWSEQFVYPDEKDPVDYLRSILPYTNLGLNYNPRAEYNPNDKNGIFPYGTWIFFKYLTDNYGNQIIKEFYEQLALKKEVPAFDVVLAKYNTSFSKAAQDFFTTMIDFPSDPAKKPYYISIGDYLNSSENSSAVVPYYYQAKEDKTFTIDSKSFTPDAKKMLNRLSSVYFKVITDRGASLKIKTARSNDSIVVVVYQYNKAGSHNNFKTTSVNAFAAQEASLNFEYDPTLPDVMIQVFNATTKYTVDASSYNLPVNTAYYTIEYSTAKVSVDGDMNLAKDFSLVNVYPMPVTETAVMNLSVGVPTMLNYRIFDASGKVVLSNSFFAEIGQLQHNLNTNGLTAGTYFLEVNNGIKSEKMNFIVK